MLICTNCSSNSWRLALLSSWQRILDAVACSKDLARNKEQELHNKVLVLVHSKVLVRVRHSKELVRHSKELTLRCLGSLLVRQ
jgi:hypothetical protein